MIWTAVLSLVVGAPPADPAPLLKTFRSEFQSITPGENQFPKSFLMGRDDGIDNERPLHRVTLDYKFQVARFEVPQNLWQVVMGNNPSRWKGPRNSVEEISYDDAVRFCQQVTQLMRQQKLITADEVVRLPSEAEWEYVARAGTTTVYSFGDDVKELDAFAWHTDNAAGNDPPVGVKKPNAWGLYDIHGYLWEWCADPWHDDYTAAPTDGAVWDEGGDANRRVLRGGSWKDKAPRLTSSFRRSAPRKLRDDAVGLRCVLARQNR